VPKAELSAIGLVALFLISSIERAQAPNVQSGSGVTFQMSSQYSRIARSEEKRPARA
jgi:hypothetical protein